MKILKQFCIFCLILLATGCSAIYTEHPILDSESRVVWNLPSYINGHFEILEMGEKEDVKFGTEWYEFQHLSPTHLMVYQYIVFTKKDLDENSNYQLFDDILTVEKEITEEERTKKITEKFAVTNKNGKFLFNRELVYELDLDKNILTLHKDVEKRKITILLKENIDSFILNLLLEEGWLPILIVTTETGIIVKNMDKSKLSDNLDLYRSRFPIMENGFLFTDYIIDPSDSEIKNLIKDPDFFITSIVLEKETDNPFLMRMDSNLILGTGIGIFLLVGIFLFIKTRKPNGGG